MDIFVEEPFDFVSGYANGVEVDLEGIRTRVCSLKNLIELKRKAGRPRDLEDIAALEAIASEQGTDV